MNVEKISKLEVKMALFIAGVIAGSSVTFVASQKKSASTKNNKVHPVRL